MHSLLTKRIEIPWAPVLKAVAIFLSLPSWVFIAKCVVDRVWASDDFPPPLIPCIGCLICTLSSMLLFLVRLDDFPVTRSRVLWILWSAFPVILVMIFFFLLFLYGIGFMVTFPLGLKGMHDSI
jgi:hypothetical protein